MGAGSFCLYHRRIRKSRPRLARLLVLAPVGLCLLLGAPLTPVPDSDWRIEIEKSTRLLTVYQAGSLCGRYPIALGGAPQDDKEFMGDLKTPLGELRVVDKGPSALGGAIGIHGGGGGKNWTLGCVALENRDIDEFYDLIPVGTEVRIYP